MASSPYRPPRRRRSRAPRRQLSPDEIHERRRIHKGWRPLGGGIEFGERAADAVKREFMEELGTRLDDPVFFCALENIHAHSGNTGHETVFVFEARFARLGDGQEGDNQVHRRRRREQG